MAAKGSFGTYVHIPKCGGTSVRHHLKRFGKIEEDYFYHGVPPEVESGFATVRHPVSWYRSWWAYRNNQEWALDMELVPYYPAIVGMTQFARSEYFDEFVNSMYCHPGVYGNILNMYDHPNIQFVHLEMMDLQEHLHVTPNKPKLTEELIKKIETAEKHMMKDYGYTHYEYNVFN